jgi:hypothetical protein
LGLARSWYDDGRSLQVQVGIANPSVAAHGSGFFATQAAEERAQADLLRDIFGPPPFRTSRVGPSWRTPLVLSLARAANRERVAPAPARPGWLVLDPARLLVLSDALEEAGADASLVEHLRGPGPHVRGCLAVDLLLGRS